MYGCRLPLAGTEMILNVRRKKTLSDAFVNVKKYVELYATCETIKSVDKFIKLKMANITLAIGTFKWN